jgi:hypothetical protein
MTFGRTIKISEMCDRKDGGAIGEEIDILIDYMANDFFTDVNLKQKN